MTDDPWAAFRGPKDTSDDPWASFRAKPTDTAEAKTNKLSTTEKFAKGAISGTIGGAENIISLLDKAGIGDKDKLAVARDLASGARGIFGVTPEEYKPAGDTAWDSNKPFLERAAEAPRAMVEAAAPMALASLGGPVAAGLAVGATQAAPTIDRVREADHTDPNADLTLGQKARVAGNLGLQMALGGLGSKLTFGASPVRAVGLEGVKGAAKQLGATAAADAAIGGAGVAADKAIIEGESPTLSDIGVGGIAGASGGLIGGSKRAAKEAIVSTRFRELGNINPQSRGEVADRLKTFDNSFGATRKSLLDDMNEASKGLDPVTKKYVSDAKLQVEEGRRVNPEWISAVEKVDPEAGRALRNLDTFGLMHSYEAESLSKGASSINPFENFKTRVGDYALAHLFSPKIGMAAAGLQTAAAMAAKGIDRGTGLSNPAQVITDKFAGSAEARPTLAEVRAAAFNKRQNDNSAYFALKKGAADRNLTKAEAEKETEKKKIEFRQVAEADVKAKARAEAQAMRIAKESLSAVRNSDARQERYKKEQIGNFQDRANKSLGLLDSLEAADRKTENETMRRQYDLMRNSQAVEERRLASDALAQQRAEKDFWEQQRNGLALRERSNIPISEALGRDLGDSQNVPLKELISSDATPSLKTAAGVQRIVAQSDKAMKERLVGEKRRLDLMSNSEDASSSSAALALRVAKLRAAGLDEGESIGPENPYDSTVNSSSLSSRPADVKANMALAKAKKKAEQTAERKTSKEKKAEADVTMAKVEAKVSEARKEANEANKNADPNYITFSRHGVTERYRKGRVVDPERFEDSWNERQDTRKFFLDEAKGFLNTKRDQKILDGILLRWSKLRNKPEDARKAWDNFVEDSSTSLDTKKALKEGFDDIMWTWETSSGTG